MTTAASNSDRSRRGASTAKPVGVAVTSNPQRRKQLPWVLLGVLLVASSILGFALWSIEQGERAPVLVAARDIDAGQVIERGDLTTVAIGADQGVSLLDESQFVVIVGQRARGPIPAGTPISRQLVTDTVALPAGFAVVGAPLSAGGFPTSTLRAGDAVQMIQVAPAGSGAPQLPQVLGEAKIWTVNDPFGSAEPRLFISLLVEEALSPAIVNAQSLGLLRLVLVGDDS